MQITVNRVVFFFFFCREVLEDWNIDLSIPHNDLQYNDQTSMRTLSKKSFWAYSSRSSGKTND